MAPGSVKQMNTKRAQMSSNENIQKFIKRCKELGFEDNQLFEVSDLVDGKNVPKLVNCLKHIRKELLTLNKLQFYI
jgi:fructose-1,6-bisphosphatase/sedoheptulose 1,7-bisphosphatase-like protein